jgi:Sulfotransferase domain
LVIVWVSSFPRSGNTFLRIVLKHLYAVRTSVVYDVDGVAERLGADMIGFTERPATIEVMRVSSQVHFVKTHRQRDDQIKETDPAICLVRDGRDALVSWARLTSEADSSRYESELRRMIARRDTVGTGSWGRNVLSWLVPRAPQRILLRYEDLVRNPRRSVEHVVTTLAPALHALPDPRIPSFAELQRTDDRFFRRGRMATHRDELPDELHELFWSQLDNASAMHLLGYGAAGEDSRRR